MTGTRIAWDGGLGIDTDTSGGTFDPVVATIPTTITPGGERVIKALVVDSATVTGTEVAVTQREAQATRARHRIIVGGKDVTYFRDIQTPHPEFGLVSPFLYGTGQLTFPQIHAAFERPGHGTLSWLKKHARVRIQLVDDNDTVLSTLYRGFVADFGHQGRLFTCQLGGELEGRAAMQDRPMPIFGLVRDIGRQVMSVIAGANGLRLPKANQPTTGIELPQSGGASLLDFLTDRLALSTTKDGKQWTVMPNSSNQYRMFQKDTTTVTATVYIDGYRVVESLRRDFTEEPNRVWADGYDSDGMRIRRTVFPGLAFGDPPTFPGTTLQAGDTGDDVLTVIRGLWVGSYLNGTLPTTWTTSSNDRVTAAVKDLQEDLDITVTGEVDETTWKAIFDPSKTGYSTTGTRERPMAQRNYVEPYLYTASGQIRGRNPNFDRSKLPVDVSVSLGRVQDAAQARAWSRQELADDSTSNWVGTITVYTGAVISGKHDPLDALTASLVKDARTIKPGANLWEPNWDGGTLFHVSGVTISPDGSVEYAVDTRARDTMKVWEVIKRNRDSRKSPARQWIATNRRSQMRDDSGAFYDGGVFGRIGRTLCAADTWTVIPVPAGRSGTLQVIDLQATSGTEYAVQVWGKERTSDWLDRKVGDWNTDAFWNHFNSNVDDWKDLWLIDHWGQKDQPCGLGSASSLKPDGTASDALITGRFRFNAGAPYFCVGQPLLWLAIRPLTDCHIDGGQVLKLLLSDSVS